MQRKPAMGNQGFLTVFTVLMRALLGAAAAISGPTAKPGCQDRCGNVSIPYPFGTTEECYYNKDFLVACNQTFDPPKAFLGGSEMSINKITLEGKLHVMYFIFRACYDKSGSLVLGDVHWLYLPYEFVISGTDNKFVAIGCDTEAAINCSRGDKGYTTGCLSICDSPDYVANSSCSGIGCCQTSITNGVTNFLINIRSFKNHTEVWDFNPCSYAFLVEKKLFNFSANYLRDLGNVTRLPLVFDWSIGNKTCKELEDKMMRSACEGNSTCYDAENGSGHLCKCLEGYQGNPYLHDGCQDIDECSDPSLNDCTNKCVNMEGSYECLCPKWHHGDGRREGEGCIADKSVLMIIVGCSTGLGTIFLFMGTWRLWEIIKRRKNIKLKRKYFRQNGGLLLQQQLASSEYSVEKAKLFASKELENATDHYNENRIIGRGGQGTVYKGMLADGRLVAVKKSKIVDEGNVEQFINEVVILSQINHRNVVKLLGCCLETEVPLLVYEFIPNGTLSELIHDENEEFPVTWDMRLRIATEVASAVSYLHFAASRPIYHRDIKSMNILLDDKYRAKVSDFGTSRSISVDQTHLTTQVQGTFGYLDPEYFRSSRFTEKSDVYSFGVVLAELLTRRKAIYLAGTEEERSLVTYFLLAMRENRLFEIIDAQAVKAANKEEIMAVAKLAERCLNHIGKKRPTMKEVVMTLEGLRAMEKHQEIRTYLSPEDFETLTGDIFHSFGGESVSSSGETEYLFSELSYSQDGNCTSFT